MKKVKKMIHLSTFKGVLLLGITILRVIPIPNFIRNKYRELQAYLKVLITVLLEVGGKRGMNNTSDWLTT